MPIYEFACPACRKTLRFFARRPVADADPPCPRCGGKLSREVERFLATPRAGEADALGAGARDPARLAAARAARKGDLESGDPRRRAAALRQAAREGGVAFAPDVADALSRVEAGGGGAALDAAVDRAFESGEAALRADAGAAPAAPAFEEDETLYDLPLPPLPPRKPTAF
ncbi:MAG: zinc ribbon domain-containing protein [Kiritimatiellae bacterium]|nr:zinc ribbon domain-containing protein [Kiritimatiellia bacterium]